MPESMEFLEERLLVGASGREYRFHAYRRKGPIAPGPALYVLGYLHPRGHIGGNHLVPLYLGMAEDLRAVLEDHPAAACLRFELCNCVCLPAEPLDAFGMTDWFQDLNAALALPCGHDALG